MVIETPGVYKISSEEYQKDPVIEPSLSRSIIKNLIYDTPAHAWLNHPRLNPDYQDKENEKFDLGTAAHSLLLEGDDNLIIIEADDWRTKAAKELRDQARENGKTPLLTSQYEETLIMVNVAELQIIKCSELGITNLQTDGDIELSYIWQENETWLRVRPDWISKDRKLIIDYKTTGASANPQDIARHIVAMGYDIQAAFYCRGVKAIEGIEPKFVFFFQETYEPYFCSFIGLPPQFIEMGKQKVEYGIWLWGECISSGKWTGYPQKVCWIDSPAWALAAWDNRAMELGIGT